MKPTIQTSLTLSFHSIHMLPLTPISPYIRSKQLCHEEWLRFFDGKTDNIEGGWKGVLWANAAIFAPNASFKFFSDPKFSAAWLDDGASRTWYLVFAAGEFTSMLKILKLRKIRGDSYTNYPDI